MTLRAAHGTGATALLRVETAPADELPVGLPADARAASPSDRGAAGRFAPGNLLSRQGGRSKAGKSKLTARLGLSSLPDTSDFLPYRRAASTFRRVQCASLARNVGGGVCGPAPSSIVASAALALAWSRFFSDSAALTGDAELAMKAVRLGDSSRQALLTAHELCAREALIRPKQPGEKPSWAITNEELEATERELAAEEAAARATEEPTAAPLLESPPAVDPSEPTP